MEAANEGSAGHGGGVVLKEEKGYEEETAVIKVPPVTNMGRSSGAPNSIISSTSQKEQEDQIQSARAEMGEVREENQRLKKHLDRMVKDYQTLQMRFYDIVQQEGRNKHQEIEEPEFNVSLSLGRVPSDTKKEEKNMMVSSTQLKDDENDHEQAAKEDLSLGLDCKFDLSKSRELIESLRNPSPFNSTSEEAKEEAAGRALKTIRSTGDDEISQQNPVKKARVSVRARCDTPTVKQNRKKKKMYTLIKVCVLSLRNYPIFKIITSKLCGKLLTFYTYLLHSFRINWLTFFNGSSLSSDRPAATTITASDLHGLNFYLPDNSKPKQVYLSNPSYSSSSTFPTITLDLTSTPSSSSSSSQFNKFSSNYPSRYNNYSPTSFNFSSSDHHQPVNAMSWGANMGRQHVDNIYLSYMQKNPMPPSQQYTLPDTIAAATKAITADPSFQSALAAALTTIIGTNGNGCASSLLNKTHPTSSPPGSLMSFLPPSLPFSASKSASTSPGDNRDNAKEF
ncbi:hypothetical protein FH972_018979 [Carpinus fangiana]|uniref:WRKY domain-containing protein n=1 Tax=Carpinus fangiana TaxID=176857 RepID=A0A5N6RQX5_9ROSI|nr:hypothetical protein FH972_018979 [Carpinus fangiana]